VVDATGASGAIQDNFSRVGPGGTFLQFGVSSVATRVTIEPYRIYNKEITITGSMAVLHSNERAANCSPPAFLIPMSSSATGCRWPTTLRRSPASSAVQDVRFRFCRNLMRGVVFPQHFGADPTAF
jgi:hypothetical protein